MQRLSLVPPTGAPEETKFRHKMERFCSIPARLAVNKKALP
jgi:hypothetical protein